MALQVAFFIGLGSYHTFTQEFLDSVLNDLSKKSTSPIWSQVRSFCLEHLGASRGLESIIASIQGQDERGKTAPTAPYLAQFYRANMLITAPESPSSCVLLELR